ncbi:MAG: DUF4160 domain-containing protein [Polaribacter sp.]|uniref:DUF4160 domain-containing protein n=1 Tax=Polaribacter sp. TaxID=1920175 RepID=UPI003BB14A3B
MPTILKLNGFRFFFYANDHLPIHVHIEKENKTAKFNLEPFVELVYSRRFKASEVTEIRKLVSENRELFTNKWNEFFNNQ